MHPASPVPPTTAYIEITGVASPFQQNKQTETSKQTKKNESFSYISILTELKKQKQMSPPTVLLLQVKTTHSLPVEDRPHGTTLLHLAPACF